MTSKNKEYQIVYKVAAGLSLFWTIVILISLYHTLAYQRDEMAEMAKLEAKASYNKDLVYRRWAAMHGGVYVPITEHTQPSPNLNTIPERDIITPSGKKLTLINPAYMTRQVYELGKKQYGTQGHITSLNPIRLQNAPDTWELNTLQKFETDTIKELAELNTINGEPYLRYMHVVKTDRTCLKCHASQGYKEGDIRGGISVSVPYNQFLTINARERNASIWFHFGVWVIFNIIIIILIYILLLVLTNKKNREYKIQSALSESEEKYRLLFEKMTSGFAYHKIVRNQLHEPIDYIFLSVNPAFEKLTGLNSNDIIGKQVYDILNRTNPQWIEKIRSVAQTGEEVYINDYSVAFEKYYEIYIYSPQYDYIALIINDISDRKKTELELIKAKEHAEESDRLKSSFLANLSHEVRTPLNAIMGFSELLMHNSLSFESQQRYAQIINSRGADLLDQINNILDFSKLEAGQIELNPTPVNIYRLFHDIYNNWTSNQHAVQQKTNIIWNTEAIPTDQVVVIDERLTKQVLNNLIENAIKFSNDKPVSVSCHIENNEILFAVKDSGVGIPPEKHHIIFERFRQIEETYLSKAVSGTGLGLAICRGFVNLMKGRIWFESEVSKGTTFFVALPFDETQVTHNIINENNEFKQPNFEGKTILIVEDDFFNMQLICDILKPSKVNVLKAFCAEEAINLFQTTEYIDLILMDIRLPDINGFELTQTFLNIKPDVRIIAQTAYNSQTDLQKCLDAGCINILTKPIKRDNLYTTIDQYLS